MRAIDPVSTSRHTTDATPSGATIDFDGATFDPWRIHGVHFAPTGG